MSTRMTEEAAIQIGELESSVHTINDQIRYLSGGYKLLSETFAAADKKLETVETRLDSMESTLQSMVKSMEKLTSAIHGKAPMYPEQPSSSHNVDQVYSQNLGTNPEDIPLGYRSANSALNNRERMLRKVEMPVLDGSHPYSWIARAERFFRIGRYTLEGRMEIVSLCLEADALSWYNYEEEQRPFVDWGEFKKRMLARFAESYDSTPGKKLFGIKQTGTIAAYVREFQELATQVKVSEENLEDIFFNGLKKEFQEVIKMKEPIGLPNFIAAVISMEDSDFCKLIAGKTSETKVVKQGQGVTFRNAAVNQNSWRGRAQNNETGQLPNKGDKPVFQKQNNTNMIPYKLSEAEYAAKKRTGTCFTCDEKWSKTHSCRNRELHVMVVLTDHSMTLGEDEFHESLEDINDKVAEVMELSLYSFFGWSSPKTTKMWGYIGKTRVLVMIDSGATHNFISPTIVSEAQLLKEEDDKMKIKVGTGIIVNGSGFCREVTLKIQSVEVTDDFIILEPGGVDIILGVQWLRTLGKCEVDWERQELSFWVGDQRFTLRGDPSIQLRDRTMDAVSVVFHSQQLEESKGVSQQVPSELKRVLEQFASVFSEPTQLPPKRGYEHSIQLLPGTKPVCMRPFSHGSNGEVSGSNASVWCDSPQQESLCESGATCEEERQLLAFLCGLQRSEQGNYSG